MVHIAYDVLTSVAILTAALAIFGAKHFIRRKVFGDPEPTLQDGLTPFERGFVLVVISVAVILTYYLSCWLWEILPSTPGWGVAGIMLALVVALVTLLTVKRRMVARRREQAP